VEGISPFRFPVADRFSSFSSFSEITSVSKGGGLGLAQRCGVLRGEKFEVTSLRPTAGHAVGLLVPGKAPGLGASRRYRKLGATFLHRKFSAQN
jgi:hypothetical protein